MIRLSTLVIFLLLVLPSFSQIDENKIVKIGVPENAIGLKQIRLSGKIMDNTGAVLPGATVQLQGKNTGVVTDEKGRYDIEIPPGIQNVIYSFVGMEKRLITFIIFRNGKYDVVLNADDIQLEQVTVEAEPDRNITSVMPGVEKLSIEEINEIPALLGEVDVLRTLQLLPGVTTVGEGSGGFNVRGGKADQNLILLNNSQIFNASHILGFFSAFNPETVEGFSLYKGFIPAQFGGRVSSVLEVNTKTGNPDKFELNGSVGVIASSLVIDGPAWNGATFLVGGRTSYSDWILSTVKDENIRDSEAYFNDFNFALRQNIGDRHFLKFTVYNSYDNFAFSDNFGFNWTNRAITAEWQYSVNDFLISQTTADYGIYRSSQTQPSGPEAAVREIGIDNLHFKQNFIISLIEDHEINAGIEATQYLPSPETISPASEISGIENKSIDQENGLELAAYINDEFELSDQLKFSLGLRTSHYTSQGPSTSYVYQDDDFSSEFNIIDTTTYGENESIANYTGFEPRFSVRFKLSETSSIKASYGRFFQYIHAISNTTAPTPTDLWQLSNNFVRPLRSDNYSIGYFKNFGTNTWELSSDIFYRQMRNQVDYRDFADLVANDHLETELLQGDGRAYGFELQLKKKQDKKRWSGWLSYTYSRSFIKLDDEEVFDRVNNGDWFPTNFDSPHNFVLVSKLRLGKKSSFDVNVTYNTGRPITAIESTYRLDGLQVPNYSDRNKYRIPDYFRVDMGFTIAENIWKNRKEGYQFRRYKDKMTISFYNVIGRKNAYSVYFVRPDGTNNLPKPHKFSVLGSIIPAISYQFKY